MTGEFEALDRIATALPAAPANETWIGDDTAAVRVAAGWLLLAADTVVAGVHADLSLTGVDDLGWKAVVANLSDLAAMGATPGHALVTVAAPVGIDLDAIYRGVAEAALRYNCPVVGGDLTTAPSLVITVAVTGTIDGAPVLRSGASAGDGIWVTGPFGSSAAGLRLLRDGPDQVDPVAEGLRRAHARPVPLLAEGRAARLGGATAMIDVSDGFAADLGHIADASGVGFELTGLPVAAGATRQEALAGGEDYQLIFCAPDPEAVRVAFEALSQPILVGGVSSDRTRRTLEGVPLGAAGWQHHW